MVKKIKIPKDELKRLYKDEEMTQKELANYFDCGSSTIGRKMKKYNIKTRSNKKHIPKDELKRLYKDEEMTQKEVANHFNVSIALIQRRLNDYNIDTRGKDYHKLTEKIFKTRIKELYDNDYTLLSKFVDGKTKVELLHDVCDSKFEILPSEFIRSRNQDKFKETCTVCRETITITEEVMQERLDNSTKNRIKIIDNYTKDREECFLQCQVCGFEWKGYPKTVHYWAQRNKTDAFGCPRCSGKLHKNTEMYIEEVNEVSEGYEIMGEYYNTRTGVKTKHKECGHIWYPTPNLFLNKGTRCPICKTPVSKAMLTIIDILENKNIDFETEKGFEDLKYINTLSMDLLINNNIIIEYDGAQHFEKCLFTSKDSIKRDWTKNKWVEDNDYHFIRISYKNKENINKIIDNLFLDDNKINPAVIDIYDLYYFNPNKNEVLNENKYYLKNNSSYFEEFDFLN
jgi:transcriptional regulator with XRE-family HTH domain